MPPPEPKPHLVLSLDGGGIRGVFTAAILEELEAQAGFLPHVQLYAGTSVGAILALGLAKGMSPTELRTLLVTHGADIFADRDVYDRWAGPTDELTRADYDNRQGLYALLSQHFGNLTLGELAPKRVLIPTFDLFDPREDRQRWKPKFLHNYDTDGNDQMVELVEAALRSSAAPTYFPSRGRFVDGGVAANNPSMCAVAKARRDGVPEEAIHVLSVGTGANPNGIEDVDLDWGLLQWGRRAVDMLLDAMEGIADYQCQHLLGEKRYRRLDHRLGRAIGLDDVKAIGDLLDAAKDVINHDQEFPKIVQWLRGIVA